MASVELRSLTKRYGDAAVVDDVSLTIAHGNLVCLLGPAGCAKRRGLGSLAAPAIRRESSSSSHKRLREAFDGAWGPSFAEL